MSHIQYLDPDSFRSVALNLSYEDILAIIESYPDKLVHLNETFWKNKGQLDFGISTQNPDEYIEILSYNNGVTYGSEAYLDINICLFRAVALDNRDMLQYFSDLGANLAFLYSGALISGNEELLNFSKQYSRDSLWTAYCSGLSETPYSGIYTEAYIAGKERIGGDTKFGNVSGSIRDAPFRFNRYYQRGFYGNLDLIKSAEYVGFNILIILGGYLAGNGSIETFVKDPTIRKFLDQALDLDAVSGATIGYLIGKAPKHRADQFLSLLDPSVREIIVGDITFKAGRAWHYPYILTNDMIEVLDLNEQNDLLGDGYLKWREIFLSRGKLRLTWEGLKSHL